MEQTSRINWIIFSVFVFTGLWTSLECVEQIHSYITAVNKCIDGTIRFNVASRKRPINEAVATEYATQSLLRFAAVKGQLFHLYSDSW